MIINLIWISILVTFGLHLRKSYEEYNNLEGVDYFLSLMVGLLVGLVTSLVLLVATFTIDENSNKEPIVTDIKTIYAINDNTSTEGKSFLFSGYVKEELVYRMFVEENGGKKAIEIKPDNTTIYEDSENNNSFIETYQHRYTNGFITWLLGEYALGDITYKIHIPKGSITTEYNIDLK